MNRFSFSAMFLFFFLVSVSSLGGLGEAWAQAPKGTPVWFQIDRGGETREILLVEEGGAIEFVRVSGDRILERRTGIMPPARFQQLLRALDQLDIPGSGSETDAGMGKARGDTCSISGSSGGGNWGRDCHPSRVTDPEISRLTDEFLGLSIGLQEAGKYGTFLRLGPAEIGRPRGLKIPEGFPSDISPAVPDNDVTGLIQTFLALPGKFRYSGDLADWHILDRLPTDRSGRMWIPDGDRWRRLSIYSFEPLSH